MADEISQYTVEQFTEALKKGAKSANELNEQLRAIFTLTGDQRNLVLRAINLEYSKGFNDGREFGEAHAKVLNKV